MYPSKILPIWGLIDFIYYHCNRLKALDRSKGNIFRVRITKYRGYPLQLRDGTKIAKGDLMIKIHLHNYKLTREMLHLTSDVRKALFIYEEVKRSLPGLAQYVKNHPKRNKIKGIIGVTALNRGTSRLGFDSFPLRNRLYRAWKKSYMMPMRAICHGDASQLFSKKFEPKYLAMSKETLFMTYGSNIREKMNSSSVIRKQCH